MFASKNFFQAGGGAGVCSTTYGERFYYPSCNTTATFSWVAPAGVFHVSVVAVGAGSNDGGGGGLGYKNNYAVTPGNSYTVTTGGWYSCVRNSSFVSNCVVKGGGGVSGGTGGTYTGDGGGNGAAKRVLANGCSGGGAGGYAGTGNSGTGGAGASGSGLSCGGGGGGGVGIFGQGTSATVNTGAGGSGGTAGTNAFTYGTCYCCPPIPIVVAQGGTGGDYGGASGVPNPIYAPWTQGGGGGKGAVRIIYPGNARSFPSTNAGQLCVPLVITATGASTFIVPTGATKLKAQAIGASSFASSCVASGGGAYASTSCLSVTAGNTVYVNVSVGVGGTLTRTWVNIAANSFPTSTANGASAYWGASNGVGGSSANSLGAVTYSGGTGGNKGAVGNHGGGGGGAASPCGAGAGGTNGTSSSGTAGAGGGGGAGGAAASSGGTPSVCAGGAGGGGGSVGTGGAGATATTSAGNGLNGGGGGGGYTLTNTVGGNGGMYTIVTSNGINYGPYGGSGGTVTNTSANANGAGGGGQLKAFPSGAAGLVILTFSR